MLDQTEEVLSLARVATFENGSSEGPCTLCSECGEGFTEAGDLAVPWGELGSHPTCFRHGFAFPTAPGDGTGGGGLLLTWPCEEVVKGEKMTHGKAHCFVQVSSGTAGQ